MEAWFLEVLNRAELTTLNKEGRPPLSPSSPCALSHSAPKARSPWFAEDSTLKCGIRHTHLTSTIDGQYLIY